MNLMATTSGAVPNRLEKLGQYLAVDPDNTALLKDYAQQAWAASEAQACVMALRKLQALDALDVDHAGLLGRALTANREAAAAVQVLEAARERWPDSELLAFELSRSLFVAGELEQALHCLPSSSTEPELNAAIAALRIRLLHHTGELQAAVDEAQRFAAEPLRADVEAALLPVLVDLGRSGEAVQRAEQLVEAHGAHAAYEVCEPLAIAALNTRQVTQARHWVDRALRMRSDDGRMWLLSALAHLESGDSAAATDAATRAAELMPEHAGSHLMLGWISLLGGDSKAARAAFERGIEASPSFAEGYGSLAVLEASEGHQGQADALIRKALLLDKDCASAQYAELLKRGGSPEMVQRLAKRVLERLRSSLQ